MQSGPRLRTSAIGDVRERRWFRHNFVANGQHCVFGSVKRLKAFAIGGLALASLAGCADGVDDRINRAYALARHPTVGHKDRIAAMVNDDDRDVRATALVLMDNLDKNRAQGMAAGALQDPDGLVRAAAVPIVASGKDPATMLMLAALGTDDPVWQVRARALEAVAGCDDPSIAERFSRALSDPVRHVRKTALRAGIARPGLLTPDRLAELVVSDPDWENRIEAARALGASGDPVAYAGLDAALADPNEFVRMTAARERRTLEAAGIPR